MVSGSPRSLWTWPGVFEDFVTTALQQALKRYPGGTKAQFTTTLDEDGGIRIRPDVVHTHNETPRIIVDAKYKLQSGVDNPDHYQMLAYCTALKVPVGWLVYAQGNPEASQAMIRNTEITVIATPLDLSVTPGELLDQIGELAGRAWREASHDTEREWPIAAAGSNRGDLPWADGLPRPS